MAADLNSLISQVYTLTNRPDLVNETTIAVQSATLMCHQLDYFWKDLLETTIQYESAGYIQSIPYRILWPNFRAVHTLRKYDFSANYAENWNGQDWSYAVYANPPQNTYYTTGNQVAGKFFDYLTPTEALDSYKTDRRDVYYTAGTNIQIRSSTMTLYALLSIYLNPIVTDEKTFSSWIAEDHPYAIIYQAAAQLFGMLGNQVAFTKYTALAQQLQQQIIISNVQGRGY